MDSRASGGIGGAAQGAAIGTQIAPGWGTAIGAVAGGVLGILGGGGEDEAEKLAKQQADWHLAEGRENQRRGRLEMAQVLGRAEAAIGASNILMTGSSKRYTGQLESQLRADLSWEDTRYKMEAEFMRQGGQAAGDQIKRSSMGGMIQGLGMAASSGVFKKSTYGGGS